MSNLKSKLSFKDYIVESINFKNNVACDNKETEIIFDIDSDVEFANENEFILKLSIELFRNAEENNYPFNMKIALFGFFEVENVEEKNKMAYAEQNAVAILFPYVRAIITSYTGLANIEPLILPPINVVKYINNKKAKK